MRCALFQLILAAGILAKATDIPPSATTDPGGTAIEGQYLEDRSNHVHGCYCEWSGESQTSGREAILAWSIESGEYRGVNLAGVRMALVVRGDTTLSMGITQRSSVLLISSSASPAQRLMAEKLIRDSYAGFSGRLLNVRSVEMEIAVEAEKASVRIPGLLALEMRKAVLPEDALPGARGWFGPFLPLKEQTLGTTLLSRYWGPEFSFRWSRTDPATTGFYGSFILYPR